MANEMIADVNAAGIAIRNAMLIGDTQGMQSELQKVQEARARIEAEFAQTDRAGQYRPRAGNHQGHRRKSGDLL